MRLWLLSFLLIIKAFANPEEHTSADEATTEKVESATKPPGSIFNFPDDAHDIFQSGAENVLFFIDDGSQISSEEWAKELAESYAGNVTFAVIDSKDPRSAHGLNFFEYVESEGTPVVRLYNTHKDKQYWYQGTVDKESLLEWITLYLDGKVDARKKSQELPENWDSTPVKTIVGSNFDEVALNSGKNVFLFIHAPWCGHCKNLSPVWEKLAEAYADQDKVIIAKIDGTTNDFDDGLQSVRGFPTLRLYKADKQPTQEYNGARTLEALQEFITKETGISPSDGSKTEL